VNGCQTLNPVGLGFSCMDFHQIILYPWLFHSERSVQDQKSAMAIHVKVFFSFLFFIGISLTS